MTYAQFRTALKNRMNGLEITSPVSETLTAYEYPPEGVQRASSMPYSYIIPPAKRVVRGPQKWRSLVIEQVRCAVVLAGPDLGRGGRERLAERVDAWHERLANAFDDFVQGDGTADYVRGPSFSEGGESLPYEEGRFGFLFELEARISETKTFTS